MWSPDDRSLSALNDCIRCYEHLGEIIGKYGHEADRIGRYLKFPCDVDMSIVFLEEVLRQVIRRMDEEGFS